MEKPTQNGFIRLENLWKQFQEGNQKREVLRGTGAVFSKGEFIAILGKSGSGKSTLLNVAAGLLSPSQGTAHIFGEPLSDVNTRAGYMFQTESLIQMEQYRGVFLVRHSFPFQIPIR